MDAGLFVIVAVGAAAILAAVAERADLGRGVAWLVRLPWLPAVMVGFAVGLGVLYRYAADRSHPRWRWVSWGSALAVIIWIAASAGFQVYASNFGSYNKTYRSLAAVVILLFWLYVTAFVILLGAQINAELERQRARDTTAGPHTDRHPQRGGGPRGGAASELIDEPAGSAARTSAPLHRPRRPVSR